MQADISILDLFLQASLLVKMVMLILLGMSIVSWAMIIKRYKILSKATKDAEAFEDKFRSRTDLAVPSQDVQKRKDQIMGLSARTFRNPMLKSPVLSGSIRPRKLGIFF